MSRFLALLTIFLCSVNAIPLLDSAEKSLSELTTTCAENPAGCGLAVETLLNYLDGVENLLMDNVKDTQKMDEIMDKYQSIAHDLQLIHTKEEAEHFQKVKGNDLKEHLETASEVLLNMSPIEMEHWVKYLNDVKKFAETIDDEL